MTRESAWSHVAGITAGQDLSERVVQMAAGRQFSLGKSYPGFASIGPWMSSLDEFADLDDIGLGCSLDGVTVQDARSSDMAFSVPVLLEILCSSRSSPATSSSRGRRPAPAWAITRPATSSPARAVTWVESVGECTTASWPLARTSGATSSSRRRASPALVHTDRVVV